MRSAASVCLLSVLAAWPAPAAGPSLLLIGDEPGPWSKILGSVGLTVSQGTHLPPAQLKAQVDGGAIAILEGASSHAEEFGIRVTGRAIPTRNIIDSRYPELSIIWEKTLDIPRFSVPEGSLIFARERWTGAPVLAGVRSGKGAVLWLAARPGPNGYERYPYLLQALSDLGAKPLLRSNRLWAFLDGAYRTRVDLDYFAERWQKAGISALHVAAWHYFEPDAERDRWLRTLIEACHRRAILVYAWLELPHVSERFWEEHPEWREKTALLQDAHLDWRKLMNLNNPDCARAVESGVRRLIGAFDWDGVNLAELYFESLEGAANPSRFTPMNEDIRREYEQLAGVDPLTLFSAPSRAELLAPFLQYRAALARRMQSQWLGVVDSLREAKPHLDLVLTHVDDRFDTRMGELIGADAAGVLPLLDRYDFTFLIEDPATVWHLGPNRYPEIARRYQPLTPRQEKLAIDINIVERYQDVYPTKQQTGVELFQLVHLASAAFPRVALYFENSILKVDQDLLPAAAAGATRLERSASGIVLDSPRGTGVLSATPPRVDGQDWPVWDGAVAWIPAGAHVVEAGAREPSIRIERLNADLQSARLLPAGGVEFSYVSSARALAVLSRVPTRVEIDGEEVEPRWLGDRVLVLPRGQHLVTLR